MLTEKFDLETLYEVRKKLYEIQEWSFDQKNDHQELYHIIDGLCRVANMYNDVVVQAIRDNEIFTADPQRYIENKLKASYHAYENKKTNQKSFY
ncbi:hypothetical protein [Domibacillus indicus]|uniref:hypothetical protein n=1 Tax=Domibacillus indicus TaxID=1437523 RepID=UPI000617C400|nr:hypothetical protein [Domibacillus indicus]